MSDHTVSRSVIFFLSPRLIDADSYVPVAMAMKQARPDWRLRFVTFSRKNYDTIRRNETLFDALSGVARLDDLSTDGAGPLGRPIRKIVAFLGVLAAILSGRGPVLIHGRQFSEFPYSLWYLAARLRGGTGLTLARIRMPDDGHHPHRLKEFEVDGDRDNWVHRLLGRDSDGLVYYHDRQSKYLASYARYGRTDWPERLRLGMPNLFSAWTGFIDGKAAVLSPIGDAVSFFSAKGYSSTHLDRPESAQESFVTVLTALRRIRPEATVLLRPHPLALDEDWFKEALEAFSGDPKVVLCDAHPEVMLSVSEFAVVNNPTNLMFTLFRGRFIDCSDYKSAYLEERGEVSLAGAYGVPYVRPVGAAFEQRLKAVADALGGGDMDMTEARRAVAADPSIDPMLALIEGR